MNTIPLTLDDYKPSYTVIGRTKHTRDGFPVSALVVNRGIGLYRTTMIEELVNIGFSSIISVEFNAQIPELESIASKFPELRFICFHEKVNTAVAINVGIRESLAPFVFLLWDDMRLATSTLSSRFFTKVIDSNSACIVPALYDLRGTSIPCISNPAKAKKAFKVVSLLPNTDGQKSLFPFDMCGIYSREKFISLGGLDHTIENSYWQKLDFGFRTWLWGESIQYSQALRLNYITDTVPEDMSNDYSYTRFWLKNLACVYNIDHAELPKKKFLPYAFRSKQGFGLALRNFKEARAWIKAVSYRFKSDASHLTDAWEPFN